MKNKFYLFLLFLYLSLFSFKLFALDWEYNPTYYAKKNALLIRFSDDSSHSSSDYLYGFIKNRLQTLLKGGNNSLFLNYLNILLRDSTNDYTKKVVFDRDTFLLDFINTVPNGSPPLYLYTHWKVKPLFKMDIPYGAGTARLFLYPRFDEKGGNFNNNVSVSSNTTNPGGNFLYYPDWVNGPNPLITISPDMRTSAHNDEFIKIQIIVKSIHLKLMSEPPHDLVPPNGDKNGNGINDFQENADYLNSIPKLNFDVYFDLYLTAYIKIYPQWDSW